MSTWNAGSPRELLARLGRHLMTGLRSLGITWGPIPIADSREEQGDDR